MRTLLSFKKMLVPVASAIGVAMLVAAMLPAPANAAITSTFPLLASVTCIGNLNNSPFGANIPSGGFVAGGAFGNYETNAACTGSGTPFPCCTGMGKGTCKDVAPFGQAPSGDGTVTFDNGIYSNGGACKTLDSNGQPGTTSQIPCVQTTFGYGTYTVYTGAFNSAKLPPATMTVTFVDHTPPIGFAEPGPANSDPLSGCTATFEVYPDSSTIGKPGTASIFSLTSMTCSGAPVDMTMQCEAH